MCLTIHNHNDQQHAGGHMYGLVNQGIKDLVVGQFGENTWITLCEKAQAPTEFISMQYYDDAVTYRLVDAASKLLNTEPDKILSSFGNHWVKFTGQEGYGPIMDLFGTDFISCLKNLNHLHTRMGMTLPHLRPPQFDCIEISKDEIQLIYTSEREGLVPMVLGLITGLAEKYKTKIRFKSTESKQGSTFINIEILG